MINTLNPKDAKRVLHIPLVRTPHDDKATLSGKASSTFSIKTAYKLLQNDGPKIIQAFSRDYYRKLWSLDIPKKIKISMWQISNNYLPTRVNLQRRRLVADAMCPICRNGTENRKHVFLYYFHMNSGS